MQNIVQTSKSDKLVYCQWYDAEPIHPINNVCDWCGCKTINSLFCEECATHDSCFYCANNPSMLWAPICKNCQKID